MAFSSPSPKRKKTCTTKRVRHLQKWFSSDNEKIENFLYQSSRKAINKPKFISFKWLKEKKFKDVRKILKDQKLSRSF